MDLFNNYIFFVGAGVTLLGLESTTLTLLYTYSKKNRSTIRKRQSRHSRLSDFKAPFVGQLPNGLSCSIITIRLVKSQKTGDGKTNSTPTAAEQQFQSTKPAGAKLQQEATQF